MWLFRRILALFGLGAGKAQSAAAAASLPPDSPAGSGAAKPAMDRVAAGTASFGKFLAAFVVAVTLAGAALAIASEVFARRIIVEEIPLTDLPKDLAYVPKNLNMRIVEKISQIRAETRMRHAIDQRAVARVEELTFKAEGVEFSVIKLLAPLKAALGYSDTRVSVRLSCYRKDCSDEPFGEADRFPDALAPPSVPANDTFRITLALTIDDALGVRTFSTRLSLNKWNFQKEIDGEMQALAEAVMEWTDPVTSASYFYLRSTRETSPYYVARYRRRAVSTVARALALDRDDGCWANNLLANIAIAETDLHAANYRIDSVPSRVRAENPDCDAKLRMARGLVRIGETKWSSRTAADLPVEKLMAEAYTEMKAAADVLGASPDTRLQAAVQAARVIVDRPGGADVGIQQIRLALDVENPRSPAKGRPDVKAALLTELGRIQAGAKQYDDALSAFWQAIQADPAAHEPYLEIGGALTQKAAMAGVDETERDLLLSKASDAFRQAFNGSDDARAATPILAIADVALARGKIKSALTTLSALNYTLDRAHFPPSSFEIARRAYSRWLFVLRQARHPDGSGFCAADGIGLAALRNAYANYSFKVAGRADCSGDIHPSWRLARAYEKICVGKKQVELVLCLQEVDRRELSFSALLRRPNLFAAAAPATR